jgi:sec-independent protein translocase protein TatC
VRFRRSQPEEPNGDGQMALVDHLSELRTRLIKSVAAIVVFAIFIYIFFDPIFEVIRQPYCDIQPPEDCGLLNTEPLGQFNTVLTLSGYGGLIMALPVILYQLARFVMPGLYPKEKKLLIPFVLVSIILLLAGIGLGYLFLPRALDVLTSFGAEGVFENQFTPTNYLGFFIKMLLAFGLAFEFPLVLIFLQLIGILNTDTLKKNRRIAIVAIVILAAFVTPTGDPFTLLILAVPMYLFYEIAILIGGRMSRSSRAKL